ncbi:DUF6573 family protein [Dyella sp. GSA-30]|uniref:DUF6573 family protein n=1 Tax=Dyella sp. GSA-30 TaxID=2994496 RepID=UPI0024938B5C|nr:DUF6573 family protein [Dyella sp. GSA-30]BDU22900.1 hypothetical protein DYGSA30_43570 [Dyella sp. GSA-30]
MSKSHNHPPLFTDADLVYAYTRADAIRDGVLIELPQAQEVGFRVPVAITTAVHAACVAWDEPDPKLAAILRLREDTLLLAAVAEARAHRRRQQAGIEQQSNRIDFQVETVVLRDGVASMVTVALYMVIHAGDDGAPVGTIMVIRED